MGKVKHFSLFSGIESFKKAMTNLGIENELVGCSEIDKYASVALAAIHEVSEELNYGDITKIDETKVPDCDLITYGFPCQDISVAGLGKGIIEGETRSGLLFDALRIIKHKKPKYAIAENVKNLVGKRFKEDFDGLLAELDSYGYNNYWKVLNSKDYGIPQNRERVFVVSIRKDIDDGEFEFPKPFDNGLRLKDFLENEVDEKYYIDNDRTSILLNSLKDKEMLLGGINISKQGKVFDGSTEVASCLLARDYKGLGNQSMTAVAEPIIAASRGRNPDNPSDRTVGSPTEQRLEINQNGTSNTITTVQKDNYVIEPSNLKHTELPCIYDDRDKGFGIKTSDVCPTQRATRYGIKCVEPDFRIRKLTPLECWRLMGFTDEDYWKARKALEKEFYNGRDRSNSQMYKMAGNSIVVNVIEGILRNLLFEKEMLEILEEEV